MSDFLGADRPTLSALLDQALDLGEAERRVWLSALAREEPKLAVTLSSLCHR